MSANSAGITHGPIVTFGEETAGQLTGKTGYLVELGTAEGTVKLLATPGNEIGTVEDKLHPDSTHVGIRMLAGSGTQRFVAGGVIAKGGRFIGAVGGKVVAGGTGRTLGRSLFQGNTADNQVFVAISTIENL